MKSIAFILGLYLVALLVLPYSDMPIYEGNDTAEMSASHSHSSGDIDLCNPLCICNCCQMVLSLPVSEETPLETLSPIIETKHLISYPYIIIDSSYLRNIWVPPKIA